MLPVRVMHSRYKYEIEIKCPEVLSNQRHDWNLKLIFVFVYNLTIKQESFSALWNLKILFFTQYFHTIQKKKIKSKLKQQPFFIKHH